LLLHDQPTASADVVTLRTQIEADSEPKWRDNGKSGLCPDILRAMMREDAGLRVVWPAHAVPQRRLTAQLERGLLDLVCALGRTDEREQLFAIPPTVLYEDKLVAAVRAGDPLHLRSLGDLTHLPAGDRVLVNGGARLVERLDKLGVPNVDDGGRQPADNLQKLAIGRGRVFLFHEPGMGWEIHRAGLAAKLQVLPAPLSTDPHYLMLSGQLPPQTVARIANVLRQLDKDGTLRDIAARWSYGPKKN
jgi:ABC-type amino acid transport substrate-binding protein